MDTSGFSQVGRYGTLSLLKKRSSAIPVSGTTEPAQVVTAFGIDNGNLTFGRASSCDVRLYYPSVDPVHCTIINEDGKAFLSVQGKSGALVDSCWVYPHSSSSSNAVGTGEQQQSIIPLFNNSEFEIHGKRFRFTYPPKEVRKVLLATPVAQRNRKLRLSMIQSAQVFSPRPSHDPRENLRILQSPIKASIFSGAATSSGGNATRPKSQSPTKPRAVSPLKFGIRAPSDDEDEHDGGEVEDDDMEGEEAENDENATTRGRQGHSDEAYQKEEDHIVLVNTNHPRVVEEERDLVILEDVPLHLILPSPSVYASGSPIRSNSQQPGLAQPQPNSYFGQPQAQGQLQPSTPPRRRSVGGNALHRAVLIRSAQRAVWKAEKEREEEEEKEEEMEVLGAVVDPADGDDGIDAEEHDDDYAFHTREPGRQREDDGSQQELEDVEMRSASDDDEKSRHEDLSTEDDEEEEEEKLQKKPLWRKSIERIIPWPFGGKKEDNHEDDDEDEEDSEGTEEDGAPAPLPSHARQEHLTANTPARRPLGSFMTPQPQQKQLPSRKGVFASSNTTDVPTGPGRYSLGGGGAQRVIVQQPWKVKDLVVPPIGSSRSNAASPAPALRAMDPPGGLTAASITASAGTAFVTAAGSAVKPAVTEEERRAIQERRRSAARELRTREDAFWKDGAPGMSSSPARSPAKAATGLGVGRPSFMTGGMTPSSKPLFGSPTKGNSLEYSIKESDVEEEGDKLFLDDVARSTKAKAAGATNKASASRYQDEDDDSLDTSTLLERMKETVESMKQRRRSSVARATPSVKQTGLFEDRSSSASSNASPSDPFPTLTPVQPIVGSVKKIDFTRINNSPGPTSTFNLVTSGTDRTILGTPVPITPPKVGASAGSSSLADASADDEPDVKELEPFSLLRPGTARPSLALLQKEHESEEDRREIDQSAPVPVVVIDAVAGEDEGITETRSEEPESETHESGVRGRPRMLRAQRTKAKASDASDVDEMEEIRPKAKTSAKPSSRVKPPSSSTKPRSKSAARSPAPESVPAATVDVAESGPKRRARSKTAPSRAGLEDYESELAPEPAPIRSGGSKRTRKGTAEPEELPVATPAAAKKRGRKIASESEPVVEEREEGSEEKPATVKRGRKPRSAATPAPAEKEEPTPAPVKRSRSKRAKEAPVGEEDNDDNDELDSYQIPPEVLPDTNSAGLSKNQAEDKPQTQIRPPSRTRQLKGKKAIGPIKEEQDGHESTDHDQKPPFATRGGGRGAALKTPAPRSTTKVPSAKTATDTTTKTRVRSTKKLAPTPDAPHAMSTSADDSEEKENTRGGSGNGSDESKEEPVTKIRVSRRAAAGAGTVGTSGKSAKSAASSKVKVSTKTKTAAVKTEEDDGPVGIAGAATTGRTRATRVMRTRTKTG